MKRITLILLVCSFGGLGAQQEAGNFLLGGQFSLGVNSLGDPGGIAAYPGFFYGEGFPADGVTASQYGSGCFLGLNVDYHLFGWLSFSTGIGGRYSTNWIIYDYINAKDSLDVALAYRFDRYYLRIPLEFHLNLWYFYLGGGIAWNFIMDEEVSARANRVESSRQTWVKGDYSYRSPPWTELFFDLGVDLIRKSRYGPRFFLRISPALSPTSPKDSYDDIIREDLYSVEVSLNIKFSGILFKLP
jgi:hypothetical protein